MSRRVGHLKRQSGVHLPPGTSFLSVGDTVRILFTQRALEKYSGSELYTAEVARALTERGHQVAVYCPRPGRIARLITPSGIVVTDELNQIPFEPDVIHGHHHLPLMAALARFPSTPAVHVWHGARPWVEAVPHHPHIRRRVVTSARMGPVLTAENGIPEEQIDLVPNFVDTVRYSKVRDVADRPRSAVLFGHGGFFAHELRQLEEACRANGLTLEKIGYPYNNPRPRPEYFLPDFDVAFAIGRSALEARACGCAVIPIVPQLAGHRITAGTFDGWAEANFSPRYYRSAERFDTGWLRDELKGWNPDDIRAVTQRARRDFALDGALTQLEASYRRAIEEHTDVTGAEGFAPYLEWLAGDVNDMWEGRNSADETARHASARADRMREELAVAEARVRQLMELLLAERGQPLARVSGTPRDEAMALIRASGLFDPDWYEATYPEVAEAGMDPLIHYLEFGAAEGRPPSATFDAAAYMAANPHLHGLGMSALEHFARQQATLRDVEAAE